MKVIFLFFALAGLISCGMFDDKDESDASDKQADRSVLDFEQVKTEAIDDFQSRMYSLNEKIEEIKEVLENESIELSENEKNELDKAISEYEAKKESMKEQINELQKANRDELEDMINEFEKTIVTLEDTLDYNYTKVKIKTNLHEAKQRIASEIEEIETSENYLKLKEMQDKIVQKLDELEDATEDQWKSVKDGTSDLIDEVESIF